MKTSERVIHLVLDLRVIFILILAIVLLLIGTWTVNATTANPNKLQSDPLDPNQVVPTEPVQEAPADPPLSIDANGDVPTEEQSSENDQAGTGISAVSSTSGGLYYLTDFSVNGNQPLTACAAGYHMASMWEISDVSNLTYNFSHPDAYTKADSGQGPPSLWYGWVRTGYDSSTTNTAGVGNCANWTSTDAAHYGAIVRLTYTWDTPTGALSPWETDTWFCVGTAPVWCVED